MRRDSTRDDLTPPRLWLLTPTLTDDLAVRWAKLLRHLAPVADDRRVMLLLRQPAATDEALLALLRPTTAALPGITLGVRLDGEVDAARLRPLLHAAGRPLWLHLAERACLQPEVLRWPRAPSARSWTLAGISRAAHDAAGLQRNAADDLDASLLAPVLSPLSKPGVRPLGWPALQRLAQQTPQRIVALGGLQPADVATVIASGAFGVASQSTAFEAPVADWVTALAAAPSPALRT